MSTPVVQRRSWTRRAYDRMVEVGAFGPQDRIELLDGEIWEMTPQGERHVAVGAAVQAALRRAFGEGCFVRGQFPFALDDRSEPEPDIAVVEGGPFDYLKRVLTRDDVVSPLAAPQARIAVRDMLPPA